ncbi:long-chain fatty acid--CoA ligase [Pseudomaricurvus alkylphenolicus]|uniref:class I adenylate-forming enzyme family protein n=1 Tax=Pseudomaricurvus alkylphenolicus TaxID=1306991 RepID=UPI00141FAF13|nr:AMP-binding protein [Pseudomaricurvus alkylphenolicus]NIB41588.1 long-chain fatty acid--CoA ligase [Pseudomaricurvus alkylphenolicus]
MTLSSELPHLKLYEQLGIAIPPFDDRTLGQQIADHARERGSAIALSFAGTNINYSEYERYANQLANALAARGLKKGDVVGIHLPNIPQYPIALAAISKLGCIGCGISPLLTPSEIEFQIKDAEIQVILTLNEFMAVFNGIETLPDCLNTLVVCSTTDLVLGKDIEIPALRGIDTCGYLEITWEQSSEFAQVLMHWNDTFMIQYTGGTTGHPKGTQLSVRSLMHNPAQVASAAPWAIGEEVVASAFPMFHVAGLAMVLYSARAAAQLLLIPDPRDTAFFCAQMKAANPTVIAAVPALYDMLLQTPGFRDIDFSRLRVAHTGAAPLPEQTRKDLIDAFGEHKLSDLFGMTESSPAYVVHPPKRYKNGALGIPVPGAEVRIIDTEHSKRPVPIGESGEIITCGPQVMKGYLNLPVETQNVLQEIDGKTWLRTGDIGYLDEEGYLYLCDRAKDMLIVGGYKVFSVEIEDKLQSLAMIELSAVVGKTAPKRPGNEIVTLYVQRSRKYKSAEEDTLKKEILDYCKVHLAPYKVPKEVYFIDQIPLTAVGKIDKKALRK